MSLKDLLRKHRNLARAFPPESNRAGMVRAGLNTLAKAARKHMQGKCEELSYEYAKDLCQLRLVLALDEFGEGDEEVYRALMDLAEVFARLHKKTDAVWAYRRCLQMAKALYGLGSRQVMEVMESLHSLRDNE